VDDVCLIANDWEDGWKVTREKIEHPYKEEEHKNEEEELDEG
jgi:hypothetical protein